MVDDEITEKEVKSLWELNDQSGFGFNVKNDFNGNGQNLLKIKFKL